MEQSWPKVEAGNMLAQGYCCKLDRQLIANLRKPPRTRVIDATAPGVENSSCNAFVPDHQIEL